MYRHRSSTLAVLNIPADARGALQSNTRLGWQEGIIAGADAGTDKVACRRPAMIDGERAKVMGTGSYWPTAYRRADSTGDDHSRDHDTNDAGRGAGGSRSVNISHGLRSEEQDGESIEEHGSLCSTRRPPL